MTKRKFFIDTDTATDDAVALVMALRNSDIDVLGISTVAGNCTIEQATQNALYTQNLVGSTVPVHVGCAGEPSSNLTSTDAYGPGFEVMLDTIDVDRNRLLVERGVRKARVTTCRQMRNPSLSSSLATSVGPKSEWKTNALYSALDYARNGASQPAMTHT